MEQSRRYSADFCYTGKFQPESTPAATTGPARVPPAAASEDRRDLDSQFARRDSDVWPEGAHCEPSARRASSVASAVIHAGFTTFVTQPPVQLDQDPLFREADVVSFTPVGRGRALPYADRETVRSQDISHEPHLHGTLGAVGRVREHQLQQLPPRMPRARCQPREHGLLGGEMALERPTEDREHVVDRPERAHIEHGLLHRGSPRPMQSINGVIGVRSSMQHDPTWWPDPVSRVDDKVDVLRRDRVEAVNERGGPV